MKKFMIMTLALMCCVYQVSAKGDTFANQQEKFSYIIGYNLGNNFKHQGVQVDAKKVLAGLNDGLTGATAAISPVEQQKIMKQFQDMLAAKMQQQNKNVAMKNLKIGNAFLAQNAKKTGVKTTASGLQYRVITKGKGAKPIDNSKVTVDYQGSLINGKVFDSSYKRGTPATFPVDGVIPGWTEALKMMREGATWMLYIPANLAYGEHGAGQLIPPNSVLIFKVHLISVNK